MNIKHNNISNNSNKRWLLNDKSPFVVTEAFRNLQTNINFAVPKKEGKGKVICVSSAIVSEGKSTVSSNLAVTYANSGAKTVLVDCDMRKPKIRSIFNLPSAKGLVDYLAGQIEFDDFVVKNVVPGLDLLPAYKTAPNPTALLNNVTFDNLIDKLAETYDVVIIDTPPINVVSDAINIAIKTDGIVLTARSEVSDHKSLRIAISNIEFAGVNFLGFVLNDVKQKENRSKYYKKYYKYGYSGYGKKTDGNKE